MTQTLNIEGKHYYLLDEMEYRRLQGKERVEDEKLPLLPVPDEQGNVPAIAYMRASLARRMILGRRQAGLSQVELARRAGLRPETINRLEKGKHTPDPKTVDRIDKVLRKTAG
jgi:DNA-binding XRE family transcriptional regulator